MDLLDTGASPEVVFQSLQWCMANDQLLALQRHLQLHFSSVKSNLAAMTDNWTDLLLEAANRGKMPALQTLLPYVNENVLNQEHPSNIKGKSVLNKLLSKSVESGNSKLCAALLQRGADANGRMNGKPLLHTAVCGGHLDMAEVLLRGGADIHNVDQRGDGIIHSLMRSHLPDTVPMLKWLIRNGADIRQKSSAGRLPIHSSVQTSADVITVLINEGLDVNSVDDVTGDTPLHIACGLCLEGSVFRLIQHGSKFNVVNNQGQTPLEKLLKNCTNAQDFHTRTRTALAKKLIKIGFRIVDRRKNGRKIGRDKVYDTYVSLMTSLNNVSSLQNLSRYVVRENLCCGQNTAKAVEEMYISGTLKRFLLFRDCERI